MKPAPFAYHLPSTTQEAVGLLSRHENAKLIAGGQSLMPMMNFRLVAPDHLIDLDRVAGLDRIEIDADAIAIGAMTRQRSIEFSPELAQACPILAEAMPHIGHRQTRNRGTIGGSLAHADPSAELPAIVMALDGLIEAQGPQGSRSIPIADFALGFMTTALALDEVLTAVTLRRWSPGHGYAFLEFARRLGDFAIVAVAALIELDEAKSVKRAAVALAGAGSVQARLPAVERTLQGQRPDRELFAAAAAHAAEIEATADIHASADYRRHLANVLVARALATAAGRVQQRSGKAL